MSESVIESQPVLATLAVGNTRCRLGVFRGRDLIASASFADGDAGAVERGARDLVGRLAEGERPAAIVFSTVAPAKTLPLVEAASAGLGPSTERYRVGVDLAIPMNHALDDATTVGHDRLLCALAAYDVAQQACVVADIGTAITVDFVDGEGTFQGGVIAPGLGMMLLAMADGTESLPSLAYEASDEGRGVFGKDTPHAMRLGVERAGIGVFRECLDQYAESYGGYPQVIATGGDAAILEPSGLVDHFVPDLQLMGLRVAAAKALEGDGGG